MLAGVVRGESGDAITVIGCAGRAGPQGFTGSDQALLAQLTEICEIGVLHAMNVDRAQRWVAAWTASCGTHMHQLVKPFAAVRKALSGIQQPPPEIDEAIGRLQEIEGVIATFEKLERYEHRTGSQDWRAPVEIADVLWTVKDGHDASAQLADMEIVVDPPDVEIKPLGDTALLGQALGCLVDNALKFGDVDGRVILTARQEATEDCPPTRMCTGDELGDTFEVDSWGVALAGHEQGVPPSTQCVLVSVVNTGPALDLDRVGLLFRAGYSTSPTHRKQRYGFGYGLAICLRIAEVHGGGLVVGNTDEGVEFALALPL
jgi:signal transduction histidine kinase